MNDTLDLGEALHTTYRKFLWVGSLLTLLTWVLGLWLPQPPYHWTFFFTAFCWVCYGIWVVLFFRRTVHSRLLWIPLLMLLVIGIGVAIPSKAMNFLLTPIDDLISSIHQAHPDWSLFQLTAGKFAHIFCFAVLTFAILLSRRRVLITYWQLIGVFLLLGLATEGMQLFLNSRTTDYKDILLDAAGAAIGVVMYLLVKATRPWRRQLGWSDKNANLNA